MLPLALAALLAPAAPLTVEDALAVPHIGGLVASPEPGKLAFVVNAAGVRSIHLAAAETLETRVVFESRGDDGRELSSLTFSPDGRLLAFQRGDGSNPTSDPAGAKAEVWVTETRGGRGPAEPRRIADGESPVFAGGAVWFVAGGAMRRVALDGEGARTLSVRGTASNLVPSPDGKQIAFVSARGDHAFVGVLHLQRDELVWLAPSVDRDSAPVWSPDGRRVAFVRLPGGEKDRWGLRGERFQIWVADAATGAGRAVFAPDDASGPYAQTAPERPLLWAAGDRLVFAWEGDGWLRLYALDLARPDVPPVALSPPECEAEGAILSADRTRVYYAANAGDRERRDLFAAAADGATPPAALSSGPVIEHSPLPLAGGRVAFVRAGARQPPLPYVLDLEGRTAALRLGLRTPDPAAFVEPELVSYRSRDGVEVHGQLFRTQAGAAKRPAVIFAHGGPRRQMLPGWHPMEYYHAAYALNHALAARGYVVLAVNFRGGSGYGASFRRAPGFGPGGASELEDLAAGAAWLAKRSDVDPKRIGIWGGSYGGYLAALALAKRSDLFAGGVAISGFFDWSSRLVLTDDNRKKALAASPVSYLDVWRSPVLLIHGEDDRIVPFAFTVDLARRLRDGKRARVETLVLPDEGHGMLLHRDLVRVALATADFLDRHVARAHSSPP